jgi:hypothetical protein
VPGLRGPQIPPQVARSQLMARQLGVDGVPVVEPRRSKPGGVRNKSRPKAVQAAPGEHPRTGRLPRIGRKRACRVDHHRYCGTGVACRV